jgi:nucleotide-binding universal stress UspA family protein
MEAPNPFTHILAPIDGSACSINAGRLAIELAAALRAQITFVYVVDVAAVEELARASHRPIEGIQREMEANGQRYLHHLAQQARMHELKVNQNIRFGVPYVEISGLAQEDSANLIVMGQVGRHGPRRLMMGSVTERVIECAPCPVLVVKLERHVSATSYM